jgi:hypothetical protein
MDGRGSQDSDEFELQPWDGSPISQEGSPMSPAPLTGGPAIGPGPTHAAAGDGPGPMGYGGPGGSPGGGQEGWGPPPGHPAAGGGWAGWEGDRGYGQQQQRRQPPPGEGYGGSWAGGREGGWGPGPGSYPPQQWDGYGGPGYGTGGDGGSYYSQGGGGGGPTAAAAAAAGARGGGSGGAAATGVYSDLRLTVTEIIKELMKPVWKSGRLTREVSTWCDMTSDDGVHTLVARVRTGFLAVL